MSVFKEIAYWWIADDFYFIFLIKLCLFLLRQSHCCHTILFTLIHSHRVVTAAEELWCHEHPARYTIIQLEEMLVINWGNTVGMIVLLLSIIDTKSGWGGLREMNLPEGTMRALLLNINQHEQKEKWLQKSFQRCCFLLLLCVNILTGDPWSETNCSRG